MKLELELLWKFLDVLFPGFCLKKNARCSHRTKTFFFNWITVGMIWVVSIFTN